MSATALALFVLLGQSAGRAEAQPTPTPQPPGRTARPEEGSAEIPVAPPDGSEEPSPTEGPSEALLGLCRSSDVAARTYCLDQLEQLEDPGARAGAVLYRMASTDEELHERAADLFRRFYELEPPAYTPIASPGVAPAPAPVGAPQAEIEEAEEPPDPAVASGDPTRVIYAPTGFLRPEGVAAVNLFELGTAFFELGVTENVQLGGQLAVPIEYIPAGVSAKVGGTFDGGAASLTLNAAAMFPMSEWDETIYFFGGGPSATIGDLDAYLNFGGLVYCATDGRESIWLAFPHFGGSYRVGKRVRLGGEVYVPVSFTREAELDFGEVFVVVWGIRIFGDYIWGDIALVDPICSECDEIYDTIPLGIPFLNFGVAF